MRTSCFFQKSQSSRIATLGPDVQDKRQPSQPDIEFKVLKDIPEAYLALFVCLFSLFFLPTRYGVEID